MTSNQTSTAFSNLSEEQFQQRLKKAVYKTTARQIGTTESKIKPELKNGINGKFTDHLLTSGMPKNASLNTTVDRDRWVSGSKDWMEHLG